MTDKTEHNITTHSSGKRSMPDVEVNEREISVQAGSDDHIRNLMGMKTEEAAKPLFEVAFSALGTQALKYKDLVPAMAIELEPRDAFEAMLVNQMTATHVAMSITSGRMMDATTLPLFEAYERAMTRLSRTYLAQMDAFKKYRAKAQQTVRVERVTVEDGGQAIVGSVTQGGGHNGEK